jgi:hypothetical protein
MPRRIAVGREQGVEAHKALASIPRVQDAPTYRRLPHRPSKLGAVLARRPQSRRETDLAPTIPAIRRGEPRSPSGRRSRLVADASIRITVAAENPPWWILGWHLRRLVDRDRRDAYGLDADSHIADSQHTDLVVVALGGNIRDPVVEVVGAATGYSSASL